MDGNKRSPLQQASFNGLKPGPLSTLKHAVGIKFTALTQRWKRWASNPSGKPDESGSQQLGVIVKVNVAAGEGVEPSSSGSKPDVTAGCTIPQKIDTETRRRAAD